MVLCICFSLRLILFKKRKYILIKEGNLLLLVNFKEPLNLRDILKLKSIIQMGRVNCLYSNKYAFGFVQLDLVPFLSLSFKDSGNHH